jgi:hypothetical protein
MPDNIVNYQDYNLSSSGLGAVMRQGMHGELQGYQPDHQAFQGEMAAYGIQNDVQTYRGLAHAHHMQGLQSYQTVEMRTVQQLVPEVEYVAVQVPVSEIEYVAVPIPQQMQQQRMQVERPPSPQNQRERAAPPPPPETETVSLLVF